MRTNRQYAFRRTVMALALLAALGPAWADDDAGAPPKTSGTVSVGVGGVSGDSQDRSLFGQYNGLRQDDAYLMLGFDYWNLDPLTGTWTKIRARNLGLDTRELSFTYGPQGNWRIYGEYSEIVRRYPRTINSSIQGAGTTTPSISLLATPGTGSDIDLKTDRKRLMVGGQKWITSNLMLEATFTNEDKDGARLWGRGFTCSSSAAPTPVCTALASGASQWALLMVPEPISSTTRQIEAKLNYIGDKFTLIGGYYGSFYDNDFGNITPTVTGNLNNGLGVPMGVDGGVALTDGLRNILQLPMALPPDNQAHQLSLTGNYAFTNTTRATFRYAYTHATQHDSFSGMGFNDAPPGRGDLGGELNTTLAQAGITARPMPKLSVHANARYENREDNTPIDLYNTEGTSTWTNGHINDKRMNGKAEATYALPGGLRATAGLDYESIDRGDFVQTSEVAGLSALRQVTYERGYRLELRKTMSDVLTGSVSYVGSKRTGSSWLKPVSGEPPLIPADPDCTSATVGGVANACIYNRTGIFPYLFEDRDRKKVRALADWSPADKLSVQFAVDYGNDDYSAPSEKGLSKTDVRLYSVDVAYELGDGWKLSGYYSSGEQTLHVAHSSAYIAELKDSNDTMGLKLSGHASPRLKIGADLMYVNDRNSYNQSLDASANAANTALIAQGGLPDVTFRDLRLKLYGKYELQKNAAVSVEVVHDRTKLDEWTWTGSGVPFLYSDNTTVGLNPNQNVTFVSVVYHYRWK